jgi:hypothetical protein
MDEDRGYSADEASAICQTILAGGGCIEDAVEMFEGHYVQSDVQRAFPKIEKPPPRPPQEPPSLEELWEASRQRYERQSRRYE